MMKNNNHKERCIAFITDRRIIIPILLLLCSGFLLYQYHIIQVKTLNISLLTQEIAMIRNEFKKKKK